jgi:hypothetical protein
MSSSTVVSIQRGAPAAADAPPPTQEQAVINIIEASKALQIRNSVEYVQACQAKLAIDEMIKNRHAVHDPAVAAAHKAHQEALLARSKDIDALTEAKLIYVRETDRWRREQERIAEEEARANRELLERQAAEAREAEVVEAEQAGATVEEVAAIIERPVYVPPAIAQPPASVPKVSGMRRTPANWKAVLDPNDPAALNKLIKYVSTNPQFSHLLQLNESSANALAKALKTTMAIPGLKAYDASVR